MEYNTELYHYGVKGMKWGVRKDRTGETQVGYRSTSIKSALSRRSNAKVDRGFKDWKDNASKRDNAIELGKKANAAKRAYENDRSNESLKSMYKDANKEYKKALSENTAYRKGVVRQEVGRDAARNYLSDAKKVKKQLDLDPTNKVLQKQYNSLMSKHDVERANARRAKEVGTKRSRKKAALKRTMTMSAKAAATTAGVAAGAYAINRYLSSHDVTLNGQRVSIGAEGLGSVVDLVKRGRDLLGYLY